MESNARNKNIWSNLAFNKNAVKFYQSMTCTLLIFRFQFQINSLPIKVLVMFNTEQTPVYITVDLSMIVQAL